MPQLLASDTLLTHGAVTAQRWLRAQLRTHGFDLTRPIIYTYIPEEAATLLTQLQYQHCRMALKRRAEGQ